MTEQETAQVWRIVWAIMGRWEADMPGGSAWPAFRRAWLEALASIVPAEPPHRLALHAAWSHWLQGGRSVAAIRAGELEPPAPAREPGVEG